MLKKLIIIGAVFVLGACASSFKSDVATFHALPPASGESLALVPMLEENVDSIEYAQYAAVLGQHLQSQGYRDAGNGNPDLIVAFDVTIDDGREKLITRPGPFYGGFGGFHGFGFSRFGYGFGRFGFNRFGFRRGFGFGGFHRGFGCCGFGGGFGGDRVVARTVYRATLTMEVRERDGTKVFEGRAETETRKRDLPTTLPLLADALFADFPGESGVTRRVVIKPEENT
jgi:hypothetical protein